MPDSSRHIADHESVREGRLNLHEVEASERGEDGVYRGVGAELKAERERFGLLLSEVSERLRIRVAYLEAIEAGRFGDLPGRIYAIGFLRSYAEFLGADGDVCVQMFKAEAGTGGHSRRLEFPVPQNENRRPGPATLLVAVLLGAAVYGGWFMLQEEDRQTVDLVPEVPESIARQVQADPPPATVAASVEAPVEVASVSSDGISPTGDPAPERPAGSLMAANAADARTIDVTGQTPAPVAPVTAGVTDPVAAPSVAPETAPAAAGDATALDTPSPAIAAPANGDVVPATAEALPRDAEPAAEEPSVPQLAALGPPPLPPTAPRTDYVPRVFGVANTDARIIIRATDRAQIFVKQAGGRTVLPHRVLQAGDEYHVPDLDGLLIRSDNVNGLRLVVDGNDLGPVGRLSDAQNNLALDPDWLLQNSGTR